MIDALGNEVIVGNWYGYSKQSSSIVTVVFAKVKYIKDGKARMTDVIENASCYGSPTQNNWRESEKPADRTMTGTTLFPIPSQG